WSSFARLLRPVMKIMSVIPAAAASSTAYWISGLSTTGSISFGLAFVTGRKRVPSPATGNTALVIVFMSFLGWLRKQGAHLVFVDDGNAERLRLRELAARIGAGDDVMGFLRDAAGDGRARRFEQRLRLVPR